VVRLPPPASLLLLLRLKAPDAISDESERHASWLELFFDLVFVLALSGITQRLGDRPDPPVGLLLEALGVFVLVQWAWTGQCYYDNRFDLDDVPHRLLVLLATAGAGAIALGTRDVNGSLLLPIGYLVVRGALILMYLRVYWSDRPARGVVPVYLVGFGIGWLLWLGSLALLPSSRPVVWVVALAVELLTPYVGRPTLAGHPVHVTHLPERIGQFTIILLGTSLTQVNNAIPALDPRLRAVLAGGVAFIIPACIWWIYTTFLNRRLRPERLRSGQDYSYLHVPNGAAILFLGWALGEIVGQIQRGEPTIPIGLGAVLGAALATWILCGLGIQWFSVAALSRGQVVVAASHTVPILAVALTVRDPVLLLVLIAAVMVVNAIVVSRMITRGARTAEPAPAAPVETD
jgi:low temperature requirement protein LtrA